MQKTAGDGRGRRQTVRLFFLSPPPPVHWYTRHASCPITSRSKFPDLEKRISGNGADVQFTMVTHFFCNRYPVHVSISDHQRRASCAGKGREQVFQVSAVWSGCCCEALFCSNSDLFRHSSCIRAAGALSCVAGAAVFSFFLLSAPTVTRLQARVFTRCMFTSSRQGAGAYRPLKR